MRVYLAEFEIYKDLYGELCEPHNGSAVFIDFNKAYNRIKEEIAYWKESRKVTEDDEISGIFKITEKDTEDEDLMIIWTYNHKGGLRDRCVWDGLGYDIRPGDELPEAGTKFAVGDFVECSKMENELFIIGGTPRKEEFSPGKAFKHWENYYFLASLSKNGYWFHHHIHENDLQLYTGEIPAEFQVLRKIYTNEIKISVRRLKEIFKKNFTENEYVKQIIENNQLSDDSTDTAKLINIMLMEGKLTLLNKSTYRNISS